MSNKYQDINKISTIWRYQYNNYNNNKYYNINNKYNHNSKRITKKM